MKYKLTLEEEFFFWKKVEFDLMQPPFSEIPSKWNTKAAGIFQEKMHEKFKELYDRDKKINYLLEIDDFDNSPLLKHEMTSSILSIFKYKTSRTTLDRIKNRFTIYLRNQSADEYIETNGITNNQLISPPLPLDQETAESKKVRYIKNKESQVKINDYDLESNLQITLELIKRKLSEETDNRADQYRNKIIQEYEHFLQQSSINSYSQSDIIIFFEKYSSLLPGLNGHQGNLTHGAHHGLIFPQLILNGTFEIKPDFLFLTTNSLEASIIFIKIDKPTNKFFTEENSFTKEFNEAFSKLEKWNSWFSIEKNKDILVKELTSALNSNRIEKLNIKSEYYLVMSRRLEYLNSPTKQKALSIKSKFPYFILSFDRLEPYSTGNWYLPIRKASDNTFFATYISKTYDYNQVKSIIHGHINKKDAILNQQHLTEDEKKELLKEVNYWDSFNDPIKSALAAIKRKSNFKD